MKLALSEVARAVGGTLVGPDAHVVRATIDSRRVRGGELFVPLVAARDGHDFVGHALVAGAAGYLTARPPVGGSAVVVADTAAALTALGRLARERLPDRVIAITGSTGKTTTKDLVRAALARRYRSTASEASFNNELGVPLTLFNAPDGTQATVVEMGARGVGHIAALCDVARPQVGVVTNVGAAHLETFGSLDGVARAKGELVAGLPATGVAVLNAGDERVRAMAASTAARVLTFGIGRGDVAVSDVDLDAELRPTVRLRSPWGEGEVRLELRGAHHAGNAAAAVAAALAVGVSLEDALAGLTEARPSRWRMEVGRTPGGALLLNDSYNANPASSAAALRALAAAPARRRLAVLGPMLELGRESAGEHRRIGQLVAELGIDRLVAVGTDDYGVRGVRGPEEALAVLGPLGEGDVVLIKGSRAAGLERLALALIGAGGEGAEKGGGGEARAGTPPW